MHRVEPSPATLHFGGSGGIVGDIVFPIISQWGLSVAMETRVFIQSAPKPYAAFPQPQ